MDKTTYLDFDLLIEGWEGGYRARVLNSPAGQAVAQIEAANLSQELIDPQMAGIESAQLVGKGLFEGVFYDQLQSCLRRSQDEAARQGAGLRIKLRLTDAPELGSLPWEYLHDPELNRFLALSTETPIVRYLDLPELVQTLTVKLPLKMLVMISSPSDYQELDVEQEWATLHEALGGLEQQGLIVLEKLEEATLTALQRQLRHSQYHLLHFIGHGGFDEQAQDGMLVLEDEVGQGSFVTGQELGTILHDHRSLRLVFLNACEGARASESDPFAGVAQSLVQQGLPAVVAMQREISDRAAIVLVREFYTALSEGYPVDADLSEARKAVFALGDNVEWATPALYMRSPDGRIFDLGEPSSPDQASKGLSALTELMDMPEVRAAVVTFRTDFEAAGEQVTILGDYKNVHDLLHTMQYHCFQPIEQEARRFPDDDLSVDNMMDYELTLQEIVNGLQEAAQRPSLASLGVSWVEELVGIQQELHQAIEDLDAKRLKRVIWGMGRVLAIQPSLINTRLNEAARTLRLPGLVEALTAVRDHVASLELDADKVDQFREGVDALSALDQRLSTLVGDHDRWQVIDLELRRIEATARQDTMELEMSWPSLQEMVAPLYAESDEPWAESLAKDAEALDAAIQEGNPAKIGRYFRRYRRQAGDRFYHVDVDLKELCEGLRQVGEPLTGIMELIG